MRVDRGTGVLVLVSFLALAAKASAQTVHLDLAFDQSFTSVDEPESPSGVRVALTAGNLMRWLGVQVTWRQLREHTGEIPGFCGAFTCTDGPFDKSVSLTAVGVGLVAGLSPTTSTDLVFGVNTSAYTQVDKLKHLETGERIDRDDIGPDLGIGVSADIRFPVVLLSLRPFAFVRYDHVFGGDCVADAACLGGRDVADIGAGLAWRF